MADYHCLIVSTWDDDGTPARLEGTGALYHADDNPDVARDQAERWAAENLNCPKNATHKAFL